VNVHGRVVSRRASGRNREPEIPRKRAVAAGLEADAHAREILVTAVISQIVPATLTDRGGIGNERWICSRAAATCRSMTGVRQ
jgi:hypothetical protein